MNKRVLKNIWITLLIIILVSGYLYFFWTPQNSSPKTTSIPRSLKVPVSLLIDNHSYLTTVPVRSSVYDLMQIIRKDYPFTFSGKEYSGLGFFVEEINGVKNNTQEGRYWIYYINGKKAQVGISSYILKPNDIIMWKYEPDEN